MGEGQRSGSLRYATSIAISLVALALLGCGALTLLPQHSETVAQFKSSRDLAFAYARVQPGMTRASQLAALGFDTTMPNVQVLSYLGLTERYMTGDSSKFDRLDAALQNCIEARDRCTGFVFRPGDAKSGHSGVLETLGLGSANAAGRDAEVTLIVQDGRVAYKAISGMPQEPAPRRVASPQPPHVAVPALPVSYNSME